jgi:mannose-6-phosphate isomerase-like protein (cupin superfamily)
MKYVSGGKGRVVTKSDYSKEILLELKDFKQPGHLLQVVTNTARTKQRLHYHKKQTEVWYILQGEATWIVNDIEYKVKPGDSFIIEPGDTHQADNMGDIDMKVLVFKINLPADDEDWYIPNSKKD